MKYPLIQLILSLIIFPILKGYAQEARYSGPKPDDTFFAVGWSDDGTYIAFGLYEKTFQISNGSTIEIQINDVYKNSIVYNDIKHWDEGNAGEGDEGYYPLNAFEAWEHIADKTNAEFKEYNIWEGTGAGLLTFPKIDNDSLNVVLESFPEEPGYVIRAYSKKYGEKELYSTDNFEYEDVEIIGYLAHPFENSVLVIFRILTYDLISIYKVVLCDLTEGFERI